MADGSVTIDSKFNNAGFEKGINGLKSGFSKIGSIATTALKGATVAVGAVTTAFAGLVTASVNARGELEQQIGGIETLFGTQGAKSVEEYAKLVGKSVKSVKKEYETLSKAQKIALDNANKAYKTAGLSAINYMSTATSFAASLKQSCKDEVEAAKVANIAIIDMSDNANKMGTSMEAIQNAYQGFAKQNYTMLDNLKLGYGGTKTEMERLLADAQKISGIKYDISNLKDVYNAIHVIQTELGITGTTAKEASETLQGSMASMKAAWQNFLSGSGDFGQVVDTVSVVFDNIIRIVNDAIPDIIDSIVKALPKLLETGEKMLQELINGIIKYLPELMSSAGKILNSLAQGIIQVLPQLIPVALQVIQQFITGLINQLPKILETGMTILKQLLQGIVDMIPKIVEMAPQIISTITQTIREHLPEILEMGIQIIIELINGLAQTLPEMIPVAIECIFTIVNTLLDNIDKLIDAGIELIMALIEGIFDALPDLIARLPELVLKIAMKLIELIVVKIPQVAIKLVQSLIQGLFSYWNKMLEKVKEFFKGTIFEGFINKVSDMAKAGLNLIKGLWDGIMNAKDWLWGKITGFCNDLVGKVKGFFGIHSPSKLFNEEIGQNLGLGLGEGFKESLGSVYKSMEREVEQQNAKLSSNLTTEMTLKANNDQPGIINNDNGTTINNTQNFYEKNATPYEEQKQAKQQLRRLAYGL